VVELPATGACEPGLAFAAADLVFAFPVPDAQPHAAMKCPLREKRSIRSFAVSTR